MNSVQSIIRPVTLVAAALWLWCAPGAWAQGARPPKAQLWIDLSTGGMAGMPEMDLPMGGGAPPGMGGQMHYGMARGMAVMPPRVVDIAFHNSLRPGVEARQAIPPGMRMGESLPLLPPRAEPRTPSEPGELPEEYSRDKPRGRWPPRRRGGRGR